jgi:hypothetical protein
LLATALTVCYDQTYDGNGQMTGVNEPIMKTDRRGRQRYTPEQEKTMVLT